VKAVLLGALTAVTNFLVLFSTASDWRLLAANTILGFAVSVAVYFGLWKPTGLTEILSRYLVVDEMKTGLAKN
jgi:hypothetical protein